MWRLEHKGNYSTLDPPVIIMGTNRDLTRNEKQRNRGEKRMKKRKKHIAKGTSGDFIDEGNTERCFAVGEPSEVGWTTE